MNLKPYYEQYTTSVSTREMAISMQTAETIIRFLEERRPNKIADVGSGFSSFVIAKYAFETGARVDIFDESPKWLYKTEQFIRGQGYNTGNISYRPLSEFNSNEYDFIFFDTFRNDRVKNIGLLKGSKAFIILDDCHRQEYEKAAEKAGFRLVKFSNEADQYGRFCGILQRR
jgi:hypothetical protein